MIRSTMGSSVQPLDRMTLGNAEAVTVANEVRSTVDVAISKVEGKTGIVIAHLKPLQGVAKEHNCIIGIRPVETVATGLIEDGHPTKDFHIKGKSANWGPQAGMICVDQAFSKLENCMKSDPGRVEKFSGQTNQCIKDGYAVAVPLAITRERMGMLFADNKIMDMQLENKQGVIKFNAKGPSGEVYEFEAKRQPELTKDTYVITHGGNPLKVLAKEKGGKALTADYDLHLIGPHMSDLGQQDNLPVPDVAHSVFKARIDGYSAQTKDQLPSAFRDDYENNESFYRKQDLEIGNATARISNMITVINKALVGDGERVVHHGADSGSPATDVSANYPATFVLPTKLGRFDEVCVIENHQEMADFIQQAKNNGYHIPLNPLWEPDITSIRRADFSNAQALLNRSWTLAHRFNEDEN
ncbi:anthrax toxin-like adenylyl cyclase domain-containing protein [Pseudomonas sp. 22526]|uniref:anthrax toxin-like adenylyl cyclase domain-containing protein n=1 Tax=Pseudomonas sp. 22526 TaxID=3453937 RepID=UPI003F8377F7